jgi:hypothetical protein
MTSSAADSSGAPRSAEAVKPGGIEHDSYENGDARKVFERIWRGLPATAGLAAVGLAIGVLACLVSSPLSSVSTSMRVGFGFKSFARGEYPDHSKFQPDDLRAPDVIVAALKRQGLDSTEDFAGKVRAALTVEGVISPIVIKERDRLRAAGQSPPPYLPDEYLVTLSLPRGNALSGRQRELLLSDIASSYEEKFQNTYVELPEGFGSAFDSLKKADYFEYELVLTNEVETITTYLNQQLDQAKTFRSPTTNLSFNDLLRQTDLFSQIQLSKTLGLIRQNGLSSDREMAMVKMDYYLHTLGDQEQLAVEEARVVDDLLARTQERSQNYVLGIKSQATQQRPETPILDQGLVDSLLANDTANFLMRQALEAGLKVKRVQAEKARLLERRQSMEAFLKSNSVDQSSVISQVQRSLADLEAAYKELISNIRKTHVDYAKQQFADAIRVTMQPVTGSAYKPLVLAGIVGGFVGFTLGVGLSLLGIFAGSSRR